jgi:predicted secreted protein
VARTGIARLAGDEELAERMRREQLLGPDQAAQHMEIRRRDFGYAVAAGWASPARHVTRCTRSAPAAVGLRSGGLRATP